MDTATRFGKARTGTGTGHSCGATVSLSLSVSVSYEGAAFVAMYTGWPAEPLPLLGRAASAALTRIAAGAAWRSGGGATYMAVLLHSSNWLSTDTS